MSVEQIKRRTQQNGVIIKARNLWKVYNSSDVKTIALKNVDLDILKETFTAIVGPSGSGKSTLLHVLAGLDQPTKKTDQYLEINNISLLNKTESALAKFRAENIGFVLQFFGLLPTLTALENVMMAGYFAGKKSQDRIALAKEKLVQVALEDRMNYFPSQLSGGQKQRVAIARALVNSPAVIFADEPTGNLDSKSGEEILNLLKELNEEKGITVVMVTHDPIAMNFAKQIIRIVDGEIVENGLNHQSKGGESLATT
ncbi:MAG: ABC transporter ATP-binding protein [Candidatus Heimdallarchaeota archaeon]